MTEQKNNVEEVVEEKTVRLGGDDVHVRETVLDSEGETQVDQEEDEAYQSLSILEKTRVDVLKNFIRKELQAEQKMKRKKSTPTPEVFEDGLEYKPEKVFLEEDEEESDTDEDEVDGKEVRGVYDDGENTEMEEGEEDEEDVNEEVRNAPLPRPPLHPSISSQSRGTPKSVPATMSRVSSSRLPDSYVVGTGGLRKRSPPRSPKKRALEDRKKRLKPTSREITPKKLFFV